MKPLLRALYNRFHALVGKNTIAPGARLGRGVNVMRSRIDSHAFVAHCASVVRSEIGFASTVGRDAKLNDAAIGRFCAISWDVTIGAIGHPTDHATVSAWPYVPGMFGLSAPRQFVRTEIGHDVWIGAHAVIMPGVRIGTGAIVGAGAIVTKDVAPYTIVAGVPAKPLRPRFEQAVSDRLLKLRWWEWETERLIHHVDLFRSAINEEILDALEAAGRERTAVHSEAN